MCSPLPASLRWKPSQRLHISCQTNCTGGWPVTSGNTHALLLRCAVVQVARIAPTSPFPVRTHPSRSRQVGTDAGAHRLFSRTHARESKRYFPLAVVLSRKGLCRLARRCRTGSGLHARQSRLHLPWRKAARGYLRSPPRTVAQCQRSQRWPIL